MVNSKFMNLEIEQENSEESSSQLTEFLDPRPEPNKWLAATFLDLLKRSNKEPEPVPPRVKPVEEDPLAGQYNQFFLGTRSIF